MIRTQSICAALIICCVFLLQGCLLEITSITCPDNTTTGKVISITIDGGGAGSQDGGTHGLVLQIPDGTEVLRASFDGIFLDKDPGITAGYTPEPGYHLYGGTSHVSSSSSGPVKIWLAVTDSVIPGTYTIKAATGENPWAWVPQTPQSGGVPITDFALISGPYQSNPMTITVAGPDTTPPDPVTPSLLSGPFSIDISAYDEAGQGDVARYRVYISKSSFTDIAGALLLDESTTPSVQPGYGNNFFFSSDIDTGIYFFEAPPGTEIPIEILGPLWDPYFVAVTALDVSGNESAPVVLALNRANISGRVTSGATGLADIRVTVRDGGCSGSSISDVTTDANGEFAIRELPAGTYRLRFEDWSDIYLPEWYNDRQDCASSDAITVTAGSTTGGVDADLTLGGSIIGTVTDGSNGIESITVVLYDQNCSSLDSRSTDSNGSYSFAGLTAGSYKILFNDWSDNYLSEWYSDKSSCSKADAISVTAANNTSGIDAVLTLGGSITGRVTYDLTGIPSISVVLLNSYCNLLQSTSTDSDGYYNFHGLSTGNYRIYIDESQTYLGEWYNDKSACETSDLISVTVGALTSGIDATLAPAPQDLHVWLEGEGGGKVTSSPAGIDCGIDCGESFPFGAAVDLTAVPDENSIFGWWSGDCSGNANTCRVYMEGYRYVYATFSPITDFIGVPDYGDAPLLVSFVDMSHNAPTSWLWEFGDGDTSTLQDPEHNYRVPGYYSVKLTATGPGGARSVTKDSYISVWACSNQPARLGNVIHYYYPLVQNAYDVADTGEFLDLQAISFSENLFFNHNEAITLRGGFNCEFTANNDYTIIQGSLTVVDGSIAVEKIVIQ